MNSPSAADFFDSGFEEKLYLETSDGTSLPNVAYTNEAYHRYEQETVFRKTWVFAGFAHTIPNTGDMLPVEIAGRPLVLVRGDDAKIRCFHNACRHRGAQLVLEKKQGSKSFVCPNHSWSYSLEGKLLARPHFFGGDKHDINQTPCHRADLVEVRCDIWHDWVFVNLDGQADSFEDYLEPIRSRISDYDFSELNFADALEFEIGANWKLAIENFIEPYHVFSCHPWLHSFVSMAERDPPSFDKHVLTCGYDFAATDPARGEGLPYFPNLPEAKKKRGDWFVLFPNFAFEIFPDQVDVFVAEPLGVNQCRETIAIYLNGDGAHAPEYKEARDGVVQNWHDLNNEDVGVIERMQSGRRSEGFDGGVLSPYWDPVLQHFAKLIYTTMKG